MTNDRNTWKRMGRMKKGRDGESRGTRGSVNEIGKDIRDEKRMSVSDDER